MALYLKRFSTTLALKSSNFVGRRIRPPNTRWIEKSRVIFGKASNGWRLESDPKNLFFVKTQKKSHLALTRVSSHDGGNVETMFLTAVLLVSLATAKMIRLLT